MASLCPYHTVPSGGSLPPVLISAARGDARVPLWGPLKWAAKLRASQAPPQPPGWLLRITSALTQGSAGPSEGGKGDREKPPRSGSGYRKGLAEHSPRGTVLVCVSDEGGHFGDERDFYDDAARDYAFLMSNMPPLELGD